jgi:hypothetical protein
MGEEYAARDVRQAPVRSSVACRPDDAGEMEDQQDGDESDGDGDDEHGDPVDRGRRLLVVALGV